jgi:hypothetical protein
VNVEPIAGFERSPGNTGAAQVTPNPTPGQTVGPLGLEFGYFRPGTVTGAVRFDRDADNDLFADDEPGMQGVTVTLRLGGSDVLTTTTDATGAYTFTNVTPNISYTVRVTNPDTLNFVLVTPAGGDNDMATTDGDNTYAETAPFTVTSGAAISRTAAVRGRATVTGQVWEDLDVNGQRDAGETVGALPGVTVALTVNVDLPGLLSTTITTNTTTNASGFYTFTALPGCVTGTNQVSFTLGFATPSGWFETPADVGAQATDSDGIGTGVDQLNDQELQVGLTQSRDRGYYRPAIIQVRVFEEVTLQVDNQYAARRPAALGNDHADAKLDARSAIGAGCDRHHHLHRGADNDHIHGDGDDACRLHPFAGEHGDADRHRAADERVCCDAAVAVRLFPAAAATAAAATAATAATATNIDCVGR